VERDEEDALLGGGPVRAGGRWGRVGHPEG
jgi:hypothetical protein